MEVAPPFLYESVFGKHAVLSVGLKPGRRTTDPLPRTHTIADTLAW
jgi:hypothetical protein